MTLIEMFNGLHRMDEEQPFSHGAFLLASKMLDLFNRLYWPDQVSVDIGRMATMAKCVSRSAAINARDELIDRGVLSLVSRGRKGTPSTYRLVDLSKFSLQKEPNDDQITDSVCNVVGIRSPKRTELQTHKKTRQRQDNYYCSDDGDPLTLSPEDIRESQELRETIETEAARVGLPCHDAQINLAVDLAQTHGLDKLLDAIRITGKGPTIAWRYVEGVLKRQGLSPPTMQSGYEDFGLGGT